MTQQAVPKYRRGQRVKAAVDLTNDSSFPNAEPEGVLLAAGATGEASRSLSTPKRTCRSILSILVRRC
ncbi:nitrogen fixation protein NifZ [Bradyrhizobium ottawaense]|uniref:nitrogen fixation protein NifZ n=1 Tax=Bradyrhizobium ottawaense TaxID=931866 RepID=UPI0035185D59